MKLYIAYGSNLHKASMRKRCPDARPVGQIMLKKSRLVFRGVLDLEYDEASQTPCGVWWISPQDEANLDRYEGVKGGFYFKDHSTVLRWRGEKKNALVYLMTQDHQRGVYPPSQFYADTVRDGYKDFGLDVSYLDAAIRHSFEAKNHDEQTKARRLRQRADARTFRLVSQPNILAED